MHETINFPNLGIELEHVGKSISVFGFEIAYYGMIIGLAILIGIFIAVAEAKRTRQNPEHYLDLAIIGVACGIIGARIFYVAFAWDTYKDNLLSIFNTRQGGLAIYGGVIGAVIAILVYAKIKQLSAPQICDTIAISLVLGQAMGRWGNFFNREAFGDYTNGLFAMQLPTDAVRSGEITERMREHMVTVGGVEYIQVHPTFLYESMWCLAIVIILLAYRKHKKYEGQLFLMYLFGYGLGRVWIEGLRTDQLLIPGVGWPISQVIAGVMVVVAGGVLIYNHKNHKGMKFFTGNKKYTPDPGVEGQKKPKSSQRIFSGKNR